MIKQSDPTLTRFYEYQLQSCKVKANISLLACFALQERQDIAELFFTLLPTKTAIKGFPGLTNYLKIAEETVAINGYFSAWTCECCFSKAY